VNPSYSSSDSSSDSSSGSSSEEEVDILGVSDDED
jgi:hypothetical protein